MRVHGATVFDRDDEGVCEDTRLVVPTRRDNRDELTAEINSRPRTKPTRRWQETAPSADAPELVAGTSFADAPDLAPGSYTVAVMPGETQLFRVPEDSGG